MHVLLEEMFLIESRALYQGDDPLRDAIRNAVVRITPYPVPLHPTSPVFRLSQPPGLTFGLEQAEDVVLAD